MIKKKKENYFIWSNVYDFIVHPHQEIMQASRKHAYIILTPLNPTFI